MWRLGGMTVNYFSLDNIWKVILKKEVKMNFTKIVKAGLGSPHRELSDGCLGIVVALTVFLAINFSCVSIGV